MPHSALDFGSSRRDMYLMPANSPRVNNRKWNLAGLGCNCSARGIGAPPQKRMRQLGQTAGVPAGTVLAYTASWKDNKLQINTPNTVQAQIQSNLATQYGIVIDNQVHSQSDYWNFSGTQSMTLQVHTTSDYGAPGDIQSIIDGAIYAVTNKQVPQEMPSSTIRVVQIVAPGTAVSQQYPAATAAAIAAAQAGYQDAVAQGDSVSAQQFAAQIQQLTGKNPLGPGASLTDWLSNNWGLLAAGGLAVVAVKELA
jgi:hypothetical protein